MAPLPLLAFFENNATPKHVVHGTRGEAGA